MTQPTDNAEWLDEQIGDVFARACKNNEYFGNDGWYELHTPTARQEIKALIDTVCREARIDELRRLKKVDCFNVGYSMDKRPAVLVDVRLAELSAQTPPLNPNKDTGVDNE